MTANATAAPAAETPEIEEIKAITLTPKQKSDWEQTMSLMSWTCPGFRHLFYKLLCNNDGEYGAVMSKDVPVAATDAKNIIINPEPFFQYGLKERVFIAAHEVVHNVYGDVEFLRRCASQGYVPQDDGTQIPFRNSTMQKAMDFRINALLRDSNIGSPPKDALLNDEIATANEGVCDVYKKVWDDEEDNNGKKTGGKGFDMLLKPGVSTGQGSAASPRNQQQWAVEVQAAQTLEAMKSQGKGMGALKKMFDEVLNPVVPWTDHIRGIFNRKVGSGSFNWKRPNRRMIIHDIYAPSRSGNGAGWVVCWGDTSGSCIADVNLFMPEITSILEDCKPQRLTVVWCDDGIQRIDELGEPIDLEETKYNGAPGGGGTSVEPVFEWITEQLDQPEVFIGFTDGYVTFPDQAPPIPNILWAMTTDVKAPFGETIRIKPEK